MRMCLTPFLMVRAPYPRLISVVVKNKESIMFVTLILEKEAACSDEARMPEDYHVGPFGMDCQEWVDGVSSSCAR